MKRDEETKNEARDTQIMILEKRDPSCKPARRRKAARRLKLLRSCDNVEKKHSHTESLPATYDPFSCDSSKVENNTLSKSAPLGHHFEEDWMYRYEVDVGHRDVVLNRLSLSVSDISSMRSKGCRAAVPRPSCNSLSHQRRHFSGDTSSSTHTGLPSSAHPFPGLISENHGIPVVRSTQEINIHNVPSYPREEMERFISGAQMAGVGGDNYPLSDIHMDTDMGKSEVTSSQPLHNGSGVSSAFQLESSGSFNADITPLERKCTLTPTLSPRRSSSSSSKNFTPGVQPFSTWKFPVLGHVDSVATMLIREEDDDEEEKVPGANVSGNKPPKKVYPVTNIVDYDVSKNNNDIDNDSNHEKKNDINADVAKRNSIDADDRNHSLLKPLHDQNHMRRFRLVYDIYESLLLKGEEDNKSHVESTHSTPRHLPPLRMHSTLSPSTNIGLPSGYYSLGSQWGFKHPNRQIVSHVSPILHGCTNRQHDELQRSFTMAADPTIISLIERRPLLQTTLFAGFVYRKINEQLKQGHGNNDGQIISQPLSTQFRDDRDKTSQQQEEKLATEIPGVHTIGTSVAAEENSLCKYSSRSVSHSVYKEAAETIAAEDGTTGILPLPTKLKDEPSSATPHRALTQMRLWKSKVHTIDGVSRRVDNENDDLVVYVGMILMGWLEVVDLLGAGTFGQVFLCKDLRIANRRFLHPSEIEGEDFQYWQCSHEYIPFSDPSMVPTHPALVAVKVVKSRALFEQQSVMEAEMLVHIGAQTAPQGHSNTGRLKSNESTLPSIGIPVSDPRCQYVAKIYAHGVCYGHHCIVMERYGANLFEYVQANGFKGLPMYHIQAIGRKILSALTLLHEECHVVHCDIKPENVLLTLDSCFSCTTTLSGSSTSNAAAAAGGGSGGSGGSDRAKVLLESSGVLLGRSVKRSLMSNMLDASTSNMTEGSLPAPSALRVHPVMSRDKRPSTSNSKSLLRPGSKSGSIAKSSIIPPLHIKLIDFSSSSYVEEGIYTYLQSRYYRAPEVILAAGYGPPIDIWSTGCLLAELLLGLPLLPGSCDYHQLYLMEEMLGPLPNSLLKKGKHTLNYYDVEDSEPYSESTLGSDSKETHNKSKPTPSFRLLNENEYLARRENAQPVEWRCYFQYRTLAELVRRCMLSTEEKRIAVGLSPTASVGETPEEVAAAAGGEQGTPIKSILDEMMQQRFWLYDLLKKMLHGDPSQRLTAREALSHNFFTYTPEYMKPFLAPEE
ncbi:protein kinase [Trypanosoma theileri]|uniref:Protein kinase n=1 Tax=Trypanosoma theileri TaxID=67003 RepID=A0A1X0P6K9_9TRYP|nr:protein kinase [Trypanosoma theileri]ORC92495.1 protein kinase [Trypanosoma theileri]